MSGDVDELVDDDGYPTEAAIEHLLTFEGTPRELIGFIQEIWWPQRSGWCGRLERVTDDKEDYFSWYTATAGWSGNEEIISRLDDTFFWMKFWEMTQRGGGYTFHIPAAEMDEPGFLGHWERYSAEATS